MSILAGGGAAKHEIGPGDWGRSMRGRRYCRVRSPRLEKRSHRFRRPAGGSNGRLLLKGPLRAPTKNRVREAPRGWITTAATGRCYGPSWVLITVLRLKQYWWSRAPRPCSTRSSSQLRPAAGILVPALPSDPISIFASILTAAGNDKILPRVTRSA